MSTWTTFEVSGQGSAPESIFQKLLNDFVDVIKTNVIPFRWFESVTMETILTSAFGVEAETQTNPNDPVTKAAKKILNINPLVNIVGMLPLIGAKLAKRIILSDAADIRKIAEQIIRERKKHGIENDTRMVSKVLTKCLFSLTKLIKIEKKSRNPAFFRRGDKEGAPLRQFAPLETSEIWSESNRKISITKEICITIDFVSPEKFSWKKARNDNL